MEMLCVVLAWTVFAIFHSLTVSEGYERLARRAMGEKAFCAYHRLAFTAYSIAAFALLLLYLRTVPDPPFYRLEGIWRFFFHAIQLAGCAFLLWTPWDLMEFLGLRQWNRHRRGEPQEAGRTVRLFTGKAYGVVRHPLYLGISIVLLFQPVQTLNRFVSTGMIVLYFYFGSFLEERRMVKTFGDAYRDYRRKVPRFLPLRWITRIR